MKKSVVITSQLPYAKWHEYTIETTIANTMMEGLAANAHRFDLKGTTLR